MQPKRADCLRPSIPVLLRAAALLGLALPGLAQEGSFDPQALDHCYERFAVHRGLDRAGLKELENTPPQNPVTDHGAQLGRVLFYDKRLSLNRQTACASCHLQENAFADPLATSRGFRGRRTRRNSMSLANVAYYSNGRFFWDERGATLEEMVLMPIQDEVEMGMSLTELVARLESDASYRWLFRRAFGDTRVTADRIAYGLAQFLRSMVSLDSKFDEGLALTNSIEEDFPNFSEQENLGKRLFLGLHDGNRASSCASCHMREAALEPPEPEPAPQAGDAGGLETQVARAGPPRRPLPVLFQGTEPTNNGIDTGGSRDDPGCGAVTQAPADRGKFKAPSLRNVALTGPYMHDGRFRTLKRVIEHYSGDIQPHPNLDSRLRAENAGWGGPRRPGPAPVTPRPQGPQGAQGPQAPQTPQLPGIPGPGVPRPGVAPNSPVAPSARNVGRPGRRNGFGFTQREKRALLAFLETLTDERFVTDQKFSDPFE